ncbi:MAG TPA: DUF6069 family protein [Ilumatobacteraceae bacterium]|jgi:hypothetical protein|nr:DUF6069 family protein [Ilumatobacteraceae bacterium]
MNTTAATIAITAQHDAATVVEEHANHYVRAGLLAALVAAAVNTVVVSIAKAGDVSLAVDDSGRPIPLMGFAQITIFSALSGIAIAAVLRRRSARPAVWFTRITVTLTALSLVPPFLVDAETSTKVLLLTTHLIAAAIIIPVIAKRLAR